MLHQPSAARREPILAAVGQLQFDVVRYRLEAEYGVRTEFEPLEYGHARWLDGRLADLMKLPWGRGAMLVEDGSGRPVGLFQRDWNLRYWQEEFPRLGYREIGDEQSSSN